jgi:hypothetical protein
MALGVLAVSSSYAGACEEIEAQDLNSRIEAALTLAEIIESKRRAIAGTGQWRFGQAERGLRNLRGHPQAG